MVAWAGSYDAEAIHFVRLKILHSVYIVFDTAGNNTVVHQDAVSSILIPIAAPYKSDTAGSDNTVEKVSDSAAKRFRRECHPAEPRDRVVVAHRSHTSSIGSVVHKRSKSIAVVVYDHRVTL